MSDYTELRRAAEAAKTTTSKIRQSVDMGYLTPTELDDLQKWCAYLAAASPDVVLRILDERDRAADTIERLEREKAEAFKAGMKRAAEIAKGRYAVTGTNVAAAILADAEKEVK